MPAQSHHVDRLNLDIEVTGLDAAMGLRGRAEDLSRTHFPQILERVLDTLVPADLDIRLDRLDLDLGVIAAATLEQEAPAALERALTQALGEAIAAARATPGPDARTLPRNAALLEDLETCLVHGAPRFHAPARPFDPAASLRALIAAAPRDLVAMLHRHAQDRHVLQRLVLQLSDADLRALIVLLAPADAALVLAYHTDLRQTRARVAGALPEPALHRTIWVLTLEFLLREAGSQFNRRAFVAHLLRGLAMAQGLDYPALLALLRDALRQTRRRRPVAESLPGILDDLLATEQGSGAGNRARGGAEARADSDTDAAGAGMADDGTPPDIDALLALLRGAASDPVMLAALVPRLPAPVFTLLIRRLDPDHAVLILAYLDGLARLHREQALVALSDIGFERQIRLLVLRYLLREGGSQFNRRSWLRRLLRGLARIGGVSYELLVDSLAAAVAILRRRLPPSGSLPAAVAALAADLPAIDGAGPADAAPDRTMALALRRLRDHPEEPAAFEAIVRGIDAVMLQHLIEHLQPHHARRILGDMTDLAALNRVSAPLALTDAALERQIRVVALRWLLSGGASPFHPATWLDHLLHGLAASLGIAYPRLLPLLAEAAQALPGHSPLARALVALAGDTDPAKGASTAAGGAVAALRNDPAALAKRLAQASPADRVKLLRWLAGDPGLLLRVAAVMSDAALDAAILAFGATPAAAAVADLAFLRRRHETMPLIALKPPAFRDLTAALALAALAQGGRFSRSALRGFLLAGLARHQGVAVQELGDWRTLEAASTIPPTAEAAIRRAAPAPAATLLSLAERFLRTGRPPAAGARMAEAAREDPAGFAALLRRLTVAASGQSEALIDRLLGWMMPEEIAAALAPDLVDRATAWAVRLGATPGNDMAKAWSQVLAALLQDRSIEMAAPPPPPGAREDRMAILRHWIDRGTLPWWAPVETLIDPLLADLAGRPPEEVRGLFDHPDSGRVAGRLRRVFDAMPPAAGLALIERLAAWAVAPGGPLAQVSAGLDGRALEDLRIRAAAAAIAGVPLDLGALAGPVRVPPPTAPDPPGPAEPSDRAGLLAWLSGAGPAHPPALARWLRLFAAGADRGDPAIDAALRRGATHAATRARWAEAMPDELLARVVARLAPARARFVLDLIAVLAAAWRQAAPPGAPRTLGERGWVEIVAILSETEAPAPRAIATRLIGALAKAAPAAEARLRAQALQIARQGGHAGLFAVLRPPAAPAAPATPAAPAKQPPGAAAGPPETETGAIIYIANAGLVLFNPFLPRFLDSLAVLTTGADGVPRITDIDAASRAVHLLQYLVDGRCDAPEPDLALNKLLCGLAPAAPVARAIEPRAEEIALCDTMIAAVIGNWPSIGNSSPAALRETFLQREGRLRRGEDRWTLDVERRTVDVLVDQIPWNRSVVYHRWMPQPVHVTW